MTICAIVNCKKSSNLVNKVNACVSFFRFPNDPYLKEKWIDATGRKDWFPSKNSRICSIHFSEDSFIGTSRKRLLTKTAWPTIDTLRSTIICESNAYQPPALISEASLIAPKKKKSKNKTNQSSNETDTATPNADPDRTLVLNVLQYFEEEKQLGTFKVPLGQAMARTSVATGLSPYDIQRIRTEVREENSRASKVKIKISRRSNKKAPLIRGAFVHSSVQPSMIPKRQASESDEHNSDTSMVEVLPTPRAPGRQLPFSESDFYRLKDIVDSFYSTRNEMPTLQNVLDAARSELNFPGGSEPLRMILVKKLGCKLKLCKETNRMMILPSGVTPKDEEPSRNGVTAPSEPPNNSQVTTIIPLVTAELGEDVAMVKCERFSEAEDDGDGFSNANNDFVVLFEPCVKEEVDVKDKDNGKVNVNNGNEYIMGV